MNSSALLLPTPPRASLQHRGSYAYGKQQRTYIRPEFHIGEAVELIKLRTEEPDGVFLGVLGATGWDGLEYVIGPVAREVEAGALYEDVYTKGSPRCGLLPLVLLCKDHYDYAESQDKRRRLSAATLSGRSLNTTLLQLQEPADSTRSDIRLTVVEQVLMGTGYTESLRPNKGSPFIDWQVMPLRNGDVVLLAGYEWFAKSP